MITCFSLFAGHSAVAFFNQSGIAFHQSAASVITTDTGVLAV
jgi:hypothetical protein